jgi:PEP-CTERM motif
LSTYLFGNGFSPIHPTSGAFATWDLITPLGPVSTNALVNTFFAPVILTNNGAIRFDTAPSAAIFQATVSGAVPEPGSWTLLIAGFGLSGAAMRRTRKVRVAFAS